MNLSYVHSNRKDLKALQKALVGPFLPLDEDVVIDKRKLKSREELIKEIESLENEVSMLKKSSIKNKIITTSSDKVEDDDEDDVPIVSLRGRKRIHASEREKMLRRKKMRVIEDASDGNDSIAVRRSKRKSTNIPIRRSSRAKKQRDVMDI